MPFSFADMAQDSRSSGSTPKPNYNKHFPRSFLLNYGEALEDLPDDKILARLKHWNCEWLSRPNVAMSEMASTLKDNWEHISRFKRTVFTTSFGNQLVQSCLPCADWTTRIGNAMIRRTRMTYSTSLKRSTKMSKQKPYLQRLLTPVARCS